MHGRPATRTTAKIRRIADIEALGLANISDGCPSKNPSTRICSCETVVTSDTPM